jgi:four helix bundle protein
MATITRFEDLKIWQMARELENLIYKFTKRDNFSKDFGLVGQINRSTCSVMSNIAEGFGRGSNKEYLNFIIIAKGSINEVQSQLYNSKDRGYINEEEFKEAYELASRTAGSITNFIKILKEDKKRDLRKD